MKTEKKITLRGKEYLEYLKFKEENSWFRKFNDSKKETKIAICAGFAWVIHGFGFILIRR